MNYELVSIFDSLLGAHKQYPGNEYYYSCPFCHHHKPKFAVNLENKRWQCWKCNTAGRSLVTLLRKIGASRSQIDTVAKILDEAIPRTAQNTPVEEVLTLPYGYQPLWEPSKLITYRRALNYVLGRGLTMDDILRYQIGYCATGQYSDRVIFPSYDRKGMLNYFVGRALSEDCLNYLTPPVSKDVIGFEFHINWNYPIVITEGSFDAAAVKRNAIPLFGKIMQNKLRLKIIESGVEDIYLALDTDALRTTARLAEEFMRDGRNVHVVQMRGKDPSVIGFSGMQQLIRSAPKLNFRLLTQLKLQLA